MVRTIKNRNAWRSALEVAVWIVAAALVLSACSGYKAIQSAREGNYGPAYQYALEKSARDSDALAYVGFSQLIGLATTQDTTSAIKNLLTAATQGSDTSVFGLGFASQYGIGVLRDEGRAASFYALIPRDWCDPTEGISLDALVLAEAKLRGVCGTTVDQRAGFLGYQALQHHFPIVAVVLGHLYIEGTGTVRDTGKAYANFQQAYKSGLSFDRSRYAALPNVSRSPSTSTGLSPPLVKEGELNLFSTGTGFAFDRSGLLLTNRHVVVECTEIRVRSRQARAVTADDANDLAVIDVGFPTPVIATFRGDSDGRAGDSVVAVGYPLIGLLSSQANVTTGTISATAGLRDDRRYLQITAPVQQGNSGGPLIDLSGFVVGVISAKLDALKVAGVTGDIPQNVNFAIKASIVRQFFDKFHFPYETRTGTRRFDPADIGERAARYTYLVECWQ